MIAAQIASRRGGWIAPMRPKRKPSAHAISESAMQYSMNTWLAVKFRTTTGSVIKPLNPRHEVAKAMLLILFWLLRFGELDLGELVLGES